jgi:calcineurin-like phosphoesterase family protein
MSKRFFSADCHHSHANVSKYCNRPTLWKTDLDENGNWVSPEAALAAAERMDAFLIKNFNQRIKPEDTVCHVGDFINYGAVKGVPGLKNKPDHYIKQLNGRWQFLRGNHDENNNLKPDADYLITKIGGMPVFVAHYPIENQDKFHPKLVDYILNCTKFQICGHVHNAWEYKYFVHGQGKYLMYNVGVDVHRYMPINDDEIYRAYNRILKENS